MHWKDKKAERIRDKLAEMDMRGGPVRIAELTKDIRWLTMRLKFIEQLVMNDHKAIQMLENERKD